MTHYKKLDPIKLIRAKALAEKRLAQMYTRWVIKNEVTGVYHNVNPSSTAACFGELQHATVHSTWSDGKTALDAILVTWPYLLNELIVIHVP